MAGVMLLEFNPDRMTSYASTLRRSARTLEAAANSLRSAVGGVGSLPPGVAEAVRQDTAAASNGLRHAADAYRAAAQYVIDTAHQAEKAANGGDTTHAALGVKVIRNFSRITVELDKLVNDPGSVKRGAKTVATGKLIADLSGITTLQHLAALDKYRTAFRDTKGLAGKSALAKVAKVYGIAVRTAMEGKFTPAAPRKPGALPKPEKVPGSLFKRIVRKAAGFVPAAGVVADDVQRRIDEAAYAKDPSTRNWYARAASRLHVASNTAQLGVPTPAAPLAIPTAVGTEALATAVDAGVLANDLQGVTPKVPGLSGELNEKGPLLYAADKVVRHAPEVGHKAVEIGGGVVHKGGEIASSGLDGVKKVLLPDLRVR